IRGRHHGKAEQYDETAERASWRKKSEKRDDPAGAGLATRGSRAGSRPGGDQRRWTRDRGTGSDRDEAGRCGGEAATGPRRLAEARGGRPGYAGGRGDGHNHSLI